jgi:hypothetical protein
MIQTVKISLEPLRMQVLADLQLLRIARPWPEDDPEASKVQAVTAVLNDLKTVLARFECMSMGANIQFDCVQSESTETPSEGQ